MALSLIGYFALLWRIPAEDCFPDAVPLEQRKLLQSNAGTFPLGLWVNGNPTDVVISATFEILAQEVLGLQVFTDPLRNRFASDGFFALAGCTFNNSEWECGRQESRRHVMLGVYPANNEEVLAEVQRLRVGGIIDVVGDTGISQSEALHYSRSWNVNRSNVGLEYFRTYDVRTRPSTFQHFSRIQDVNASGLLQPCDALGIHDQASLQSYLSLTGDTDGVVVGESLQLRCMDHHWWFAPACRNRPEECIPTVTCTSWGFAWYIEEIVWKATTWNMPLAVGAAADCGQNGDYAQIPRQYNILFYFWSPDGMFNDIQPERVIFPSYNRRAWQVKDYSTVRQDVPLLSLMNQDVNLWAPDIGQFLAQMKWDINDVNDLLATQEPTMTWNETLAAVCSWLKEHRNVWENWIPVSTQCLAGQGLYSEHGDFVSNVSDATTCRGCFPGHHSQTVDNGNGGITAVCMPCEAGRSQPSYGSISCDPCPPGTYMANTGAKLCERCPQGEYQDTEAQTSCIQCEASETTKILGATSRSDCECQVDHFWQRSSQQCQVCGQGLLCRGGSASPLQKEGYWVDAQVEEEGDLQLSVYSCSRERRCPAGELGGCADHRGGRACGYCEVGFLSAAGAKCQECHVEMLWPLILLALVVLAVGSWPQLELQNHAFANSRSVKALLVVAVMLGQGVACVQNLEAIRQFDIEWTEPVASWLSALSIVTLELDMVGVSCFVSAKQVTFIYICQLLVFPVFVLLTYSVFRFTRVLARLRRMNTADSRGIISIYLLFLVSFYTAISLMVFMPLECRQNPNGKFTLAQHNQVICGESDHSLLLPIACCGILVYPVGVFAVLLRITWKYPAWLSSAKGIETLQQFRIIFGKFKPERYYYCLFLTGSNLIIATMPAVLLSFPVMQICAMCCIISLKHTVLCFLWPWKENLANWTELMLGGGFMVLLILVAPLMNFEESAQSFTFLLMFVVLSFPTSLLFGSAFYLAKLRHSGAYGAFLCHHKASAGALSRYLKSMMIRADPYAKIFYDADNLTDLGQLFQIVKSDVKCLVILFSPGLFHSPWCTGEICTAFGSDVRSIGVAVDGYTAPDGDEVNLMLSGWTQSHRMTLLNYGFNEEHVKSAFAYLHRIPVIEFTRSQSPALQAEAASKVNAAVFGTRLAVSTSADKAKVVVCGASAAATSPEAVSICLILQLQLQVALQVPTSFAQSASDIESAGSRATCLVIVLTKGIMEDPHFGDILMSKASLKRLVLSDGTFEFPRGFFKRFTDDMPEVKHKDELEEADMMKIAAMQSLCMHIALPWTPQGSEGTMQQQLRAICDRMGDVEAVKPDESWKPGLVSSKKNPSIEDEEVEIYF